MMDLRALWAKTFSDGRFHPLLCHMLDVGAVAQALLRSDRAGHVVVALAGLLGAEHDDVRAVVPCLVALHDLGKCSPSFERKSPEHWQRVRDAGFPDSPNPLPGFDHALEARLVLRDVLERIGILRADQSRPFLDAVAHGVAAHHGRFFTPGAQPEVRHDDRDLHEPWHKPWRAARHALAQNLRQVLFPERPAVPCSPGNLSALCMLLSGLTVLCDWIGSDETIFEPYDGDLALYPAVARERAARAFESRRLLLGYLPPMAHEPTFANLFDVRPRPLQEGVGPARLPLPRQALVVVEAPTGEGKTEAALLLAARLAFTGQVDGFYFALPTMATSNQMFQRVQKYLGRRLGDEGEATLQLVHGLAEFSPELAELLERAGHEGLAPEERVVADSWLLPRKLSLLAPYGVGTVDQAMLAALNVRFGSLRMFGMAGKVVVVDEVHAYDLYMSTILDELLRWLGALGASVVLLSATLPRAKRESLAAAFQGRADLTPGAADELEPYPLITVVGGPRAAQYRRMIQVPAASSRRIRLQRRSDGVAYRQGNARFLVGELAAGGCAAWLCNTVAEAQACYLALKETIATQPVDQRPQLTLFHARFPHWRRREIEEGVLSAFGPNGTRPRRAILVATQVVEQSLDLDFDLMVSQLAPIDLLIQRAGRVHRHARNGRPGEPRLIILMPPSAGGEFEFGPYGEVYQPYVLLRTIAALHGRDGINVPGELRLLIEQVYGHSRLDLASAGLSEAILTKARLRFEQREGRMRAEAEARRLQDPRPDGRFAANPRLPFDEEAAEGDLWIAAQTRLAEPSVRAVLLETGHPLLARLAARASRVRLDLGGMRAVLEHAVTIASAALVRHVMSGADGGRVHSLDRVRGLKGRYLIELALGAYSWHEGSIRHRLDLSEELGVVIEKEVAA